MHTHTKPLLQKLIFWTNVLRKKKGVCFEELFCELSVTSSVYSMGHWSGGWCRAPYAGKLTNISLWLLPGIRFNCVHGKLLPQALREKRGKETTKKAKNTATPDVLHRTVDTWWPTKAPKELFTLCVLHEKLPYCQPPSWVKETLIAPRSTLT